ncbi:MAG: hypothetical protein ACI9QD_000575 [Thermoproteota archaeon]|jgi:hypothetical protein
MTVKTESLLAVIGVLKSEDDEKLFLETLDGEIVFLKCSKELTLNKEHLDHSLIVTGNILNKENDEKVLNVEHFEILSIKHNKIQKSA